MSIEMLLVLGFLSSFESGDSCIDALHEMRVTDRVDIVSTAVLEDNVIIYTLTDGPRIGAKTAILVCRRDLLDEGIEDDGDDESVDEMPVEDEPVDGAVDDGEEVAE